MKQKQMELKKRLVEILGEPVSRVGKSEMVWAIGALDFRVKFGEKHTIYETNRETGETLQFGGLTTSLLLARARQLFRFEEYHEQETETSNA